MTLRDLLNILPRSDYADSTPVPIKPFTEYDVVLVYDAHGKLAGGFSDDSSFANTIRYLSANPQLTPNIFTPSIRCVIIQYKENYAKK